MTRKILFTLFSLSLLTSACLAAPKNHKKALKAPQKIEAKESQKVEAPASPPAITLATNNPNLPPVIAASVKINTTAAQAIVIDHYTGRVILEKNADELVYPSSMTKIMTAYMIFDHLKDGSLRLDTPLMVSSKAWKMGGSKMFVGVDSLVSVDDLLHGVIIQSGNDACVALAEGVSGSEEVFAAEMTQRARELGALHTTFKNASGWPDPEHLTTVRDLSLIAQRLIDDYPHHYSLFGEKEFTYNNITQPNRNPLLFNNSGSDGLKTGFTDTGQYGLVASAKEIEPEGTEKRFNLVINGLPTMKARAEEATKLMTWAMKNFASIRLFKAGQVVETAPVWLGSEETVPLTVAKDCRITIPQAARKDAKVEVVYDRPLSAPLTAGQEVGKVLVTAPTLETPLEFPLITASEVKKAGFFKRIIASITYLIWGKA
ncbi:D-alanyl-D-alanine carboxypeptidase family protein [Candidatus Paracaedibacter symbiosus]|uniref:D-alanyl-D-alanine carboxypeptidase family protein n=1 Tax=Candidatus Paracaedibacter symbiosus TaxID=244582 RepID=UPI00068CA2C7|nr:D-alanyl-D-alanine carboxypeptidase family protein [Candidatus Paracaedibacter symbiosus]